MFRTWFLLPIVLLMGCSTPRQRLDSTTLVDPSGIDTDVPIEVCTDCGTVLPARTSRCPGCGQKQYTSEELRRADKMRIHSPFSDPPNTSRPVSPVTAEIRIAKERLRLVKRGMKVEDVEATLGLSRFASQRLIGSGSISLSIHYDLGNGHKLDMVYDRRFHPSSIDFVLSAVIVDEAKWVSAKN